MTHPAETLAAWRTWQQQRPLPDANLLLVPGQTAAMVDSGFVGHARQTAAWVREQAPDLAHDVNHRNAGCCSAQRWDQPVAPYPVDHPVDDGEVLRLGETDWEVVATPGHTPGHLSLRPPEERLLVMGDTLCDDDVGWLDLVLNGYGAAATSSTRSNVSLTSTRACS